MTTILPLVADTPRAEYVDMFSIQCPRHGGRVLLFAENIEAVVNTASGVEIHWRCTCDETGIERVTRRGDRSRSDTDRPARASV